MEVGTKQIYLSNFASMVMEQGAKYVASHHPAPHTMGTPVHLDLSISELTPGPFHQLLQLPYGHVD